MSTEKRWRFEIQHGPEGEVNYAWVYDDQGVVVATMRTHKAKEVVDSMNTHAVPDVPELVAVSHEVFYAPTREWRRTVEPEYYRKNGDLVRDLIDKSKAAAMLAAKDKEIQELKEKLGVVSTERHADAEYIGQLQAELAQIKAQEPVAWMYVNEDGECEQIEYGEIFDDPHVTPLYAAPVASEDLKATNELLNAAIDDYNGMKEENERLREALKPFAEYMQDHGDKDNLGTPVPNERGVGWIYLNHGHFRNARAAIQERSRHE